MQNFNGVDQIRKNVSLYFDNELSKEAEQELLQNVDKDPACHQIFNKEKSAREFLKANIKRSTVSDDIMNQIKKNIPF